MPNGLAFAVGYIAGGIAGVGSMTSGLGLLLAAGGTVLAILGHLLCSPASGARRRAGTAALAGLLSALITWPADPRFATVIYDVLPFPTVLLLLHFVAVAAIVTAVVEQAFRALEDRRRT